MPSWVQNPNPPYNLIPKEEYHQDVSIGLYIHGDIESFESPIDKSIISDRGQLRKHMKEHGVTNSADYPADYMKKRSQERNAEMFGDTSQATAERRELLNQELRKHGI